MPLVYFVRIFLAWNGSNLWIIYKLSVDYLLTDSLCWLMVMECLAQIYCLVLETGFCSLQFIDCFE